jgi:hypothetical protein
VDQLDRENDQNPAPWDVCGEIVMKTEAVTYTPFIVAVTSMMTEPIPLPAVKVFEVPELCDRLPSESDKVQA